MKVVKRSQVTEVTIKRNVYHTLKVGNKVYDRVETMKTYIPYMDMEVVINNDGKSDIKWSVRVSSNTSSYLSAKQVKELKLEESFKKLDLNSLNGNYIW